MVVLVLGSEEGAKAAALSCRPTHVQGGSRTRGHPRLVAHAGARAAAVAHPPCGRQHQRKHAVRVPRQLLQDGQRERRRLAAARVRDTDDVTPRQHRGDCPPLHLGGRGHAQPSADAVQPLREAQLTKAAGSIGF